MFSSDCDLSECLCFGVLKALSYVPCNDMTQVQYIIIMGSNPSKRHWWCYKKSIELQLLLCHI